MKKISFIVLISALVFVSCVKQSERDCSPVGITAPPSEVDSLRSYLYTNGINATEDSRGFFYVIHTPGEIKPTICNAVSVTYVGTLTNGTQFDAQTNVSFYLSQLITGWQEGIPLIGTGGSITLYLPPTLGYGSQDYGAIPGNSILTFNISLLAVN